MGINATSVTRLDAGGWRFVWPAGTGPYPLWLEGKLIGTATTPTYDFTLPGFEDAPPDLEILNAGDVAENQLYPPYVTIQWEGVPNADSYEVQQLIGATWTVVGQSTDRGAGYFRWDSEPLVDSTVYQFRVVPLSEDGIAGTPLPMTTEVCRNPRHPEVSLSLSSSGDVVVSGG